MMPGSGARPLPLRSPALVVVAAGLCSRLLFLALVLVRSGSGATLIAEDSALYLSAARGLLGTGSMPIDNFLMPVYPLLLGGVLAIADAPSMGFIALAGLCHAAMFALICLLTFRLAEALTDSATALAAGLLMCLLPDAWPYSMMLMPDALFTCFMLAGLFVAVSARRRGADRLGLVLFGGAGLLCGLAVLVKPIGFLIGAAASGILPLFAPGRWRARLLLCALALLGFAVVPTAWVARNYVVHGVPTLSLQSGEHLYSFVRFNMLSDAGLDAAAIAKKEIGGGLPPGLAAQNRVLGRLAAEDIRAHPGWLLRSIALRHWQLYAGTGTRALLRMLGAIEKGADLPAGLAAFWRGRPGIAALQGLSWLILLSVYALAAWGALAMIRERRWLLFILCGAAIASFAVQVMNVPHTRYRFFMDPFLCVFAAVGLRRPGRSGAP